MTFALLDLKLIANAPNGHDIPFRILGNVQFVANALDKRIDRAGIPVLRIPPHFFKQLIARKNNARV